MHAEGEGFASARPKDHDHIAKGDEARHEHEFAEQARRPIGHEQEDKKAGTMSRVPFTDSHALNPVDGGGELAMPKAADAVAAPPKAYAKNRIAAAIRPESAYPIWIIRRISYPLQVI